MKKVFLMGLVIFTAGCVQHKPVESLTFEEKEAIAKECQANGKIATDDYCKQVASVYVNDVEERKNKEHQKKWQNHNTIPKAPF